MKVFCKTHNRKLYLHNWSWVTQFKITISFSPTCSLYKLQFFLRLIESNCKSLRALKSASYCRLVFSWQASFAMASESPGFYCENLPPSWKPYQVSVERKLFAMRRKITVSMKVLQNYRLSLNLIIESISKMGTYATEMAEPTPNHHCIAHESLSDSRSRMNRERKERHLNTMRGFYCTQDDDTANVNMWIWWSDIEFNYHQ